MSDVLYHATPFSRFYSIREKGLVPEPEHPVHLSAHDRRDFIACLHLVPVADVALLQVDVSGLPVEEGWDGQGSFLVHQTVASWRITLLG